MNSYETAMLIKDLLKQNGFGGSQVEKELGRMYDDEWLITIQLGEHQSFEIRVHESLPEHYFSKKEKANEDSSK